MVLKAIHFLNPEIYPSTMFTTWKRCLKTARSVKFAPKRRVQLAVLKGAPRRAPIQATRLIPPCSHVEILPVPYMKFETNDGRYTLNFHFIFMIMGGKGSRRVVSVRILLGGCLVGVNREGFRSSVGSEPVPFGWEGIADFPWRKLGRRMILRTKTIAFLMDSDVSLMESDED